MQVTERRSWCSSLEIDGEPAQLREAARVNAGGAELKVKVKVDVSQAVQESNTKPGSTRDIHVQTEPEGRCALRAYAERGSLLTLGGSFGLLRVRSMHRSGCVLSRI